jgi:enoyl-CoA hydratase
MARYETLICEEREGIAYITLNRPDFMNAISPRMIEEMEVLLAEIDCSGSILGVIITGEGRAFCAGADLHQNAADRINQQFTSREFAVRAQGVMNSIESLRQPVIAAVNGYALGGGCELALACDLRLAGEKAVFGLPEAGLGIIPCFGGTQRLPRLIGTARAKEMIFTARKVRADEAVSLGIVNAAVPQGALLGAASDKMKEIFANAPVAVSMVKEAINRGMQMPLASALGLEPDMLALLKTTEDSQEGRQAFREKRAPHYKNR